MLRLLALLACASDEEIETVDAVASDLYMLEDRGDQSPEAIARSLELLPSRDYADFVDLGTAYLWMGSYLPAAEAYEMAAREASTREEVVGALYNKTAALAYGQRLDLACDTAGSLTRLAPDSPDAAWLRFSLYRYNDDPLGALVAQDHLIQVDPEAAGDQVMDPVTAAVVLGSIAILAGTYAYVRTVKLVPPSDRAEVVIPMFNAYTGLVETSVEATPVLPDLGRQLATP